MSESNQALVDALVKFQRWCEAGGPDLTAQLAAAESARDEARKECEGLKENGAKLAAAWRARALNERAFGVDAGKAPSCRCSEELAALLAGKEAGDGE
jgi:hypothetical protein